MQLEGFMASRVMHLAVAKLIDEKIELLDRNSFFLGNLAPDLGRYGNRQYEESHFGATTDNLKGIDYLRFFEKYSDNGILDDFKLGYFVHLLTDAIWLKYIQQVFIRKYPEKKTKLYKLGYSDMSKYNPIIINLFELEKPNDCNIIDDIDEVELDLISKIISDLEDDFDVEFIDTKFLVYPYADVLNFINASVHVSTENIYRIRNNQLINEPNQYFVPIE